MVVFFDIDGTIVDEETQLIPESTIRAVEQLKNNGHIAVVNTGRPMSHIDPRVRALDFSGWVCGCGMEVYLNGQWLYRKHPDILFSALEKEDISWKNCSKSKNGGATSGQRSWPVSRPL